MSELSRFIFSRLAAEGSPGEGFASEHAGKFIRLVDDTLKGWLFLFHSAEVGTALYTPDRSANAVIKGMYGPRFVWSGQRTAWYVQHSADKEFPPYGLADVAKRLTAQGLKVAFEFQREKGRSIAERVEAFRERAAARAERYGTYGEHAEQRSEQAYQRSHEIGERFALGQPILVGHHSEKSARRDQARIHAAMSKSVSEADKAAYWEGRARAAGISAMGDRSPGTVMRRIERLEADLRGVERNLAGENKWIPLKDESGEPLLNAEGGKRYKYDRVMPSGEHKERLESMQEDLQEQIEYWKSTLAVGGKRPYGPNDFYMGQKVGKYIVINVGPKSVTYASPNGEYTWTKKTHQEYNRMGTTTAPEVTREEVEPYKGKHPRATLIANIYQKAQYPLRIAGKHAIVVWDDKDATFDQELITLEDADDTTLDALADKFSVADEKAKAHPDDKLIKAIYSKWWPEYRSYKQGLHTVTDPHNFEYKRFVLENMAHDDLLALAERRHIDVNAVEAPKAKDRLGRLKEFLAAAKGDPYAKRTIEGVQCSRDLAKALVNVIENVNDANREKLLGMPMNAMVGSILTVLKQRDEG